MSKELINIPSVTNWSAYGLSEYLLMAHPSNEVHEKVMKEKERFCDMYKKEDAVAARSHVTVFTLLGKESLEKTIVDLCQQACNNQPALPVCLSNFSSFYSHTLFFNIHDHQPFKQLRKRLGLVSRFYRSNNFPPPRFSNKPHLSLIRGLSGQVYHKAISEYERRSFNASFTVNELVLIKRKYQYATCETVGVIKLLPPRPAYTQLKFDL